jgi:thiol-disulfide isomerase/thioredoxin
MNRLAQIGLLSGALAVGAGAARQLNIGGLVSTPAYAASSIRAPEFPAGLTWLNSQPLSMRALRGKVVLLDFWTYGCINCQHILPDLHRLDQKYGNQLVVISVHSAKFEREGEAKNIRDAVLRTNIEHPVLVDKGMRVWDEYTVKAWPTLVLVAPDGRVANQLAGEGHYDELDKQIGSLVSTFRARKELNETPLKLTLERAKTAQTPLFYPGKVAASDGVIVVADSSHNRLVVSDQSGTTLATIGSGEAGLSNGSFQTATFWNPQGVFVDGEKIYVADTNNHAIRLVDLAAKTVSTLAGTGKQAAYMATGGPAKTSALSSPWDVLRVNDALYIAMAGNHQIWRLDLKSNVVAPWAGDGNEARRDGNRQSASFAQPSGLASDGKNLFVADAESSCIRRVDFATGQVQTLAGGDLFDFGDRDGVGNAARFQHPLGLALQDGQLYISDAYNGKVKQLDPATGRVKTVLSGLAEPGGLAFDGNRLLVADTAHQVVKSVDLGNSKATILTMADLSAPRLAVREAKVDERAQDARATFPVGKATLVFEPVLPQGFHLNRQAPLKLTVKTTGTGVKAVKTTFKGDEFQNPTRIALQTGASGSGTIELDAFVSYCDTGTGAVCKVQRVIRSVPFSIGATGQSETRVRVELP